MAKHNIGALLVLDDHLLAGIFSERDYARKVALKDKSSSDAKRLGEVITKTGIVLAD
jgi:CBS domain-containing protein